MNEKNAYDPSWPSPDIDGGLIGGARFPRAEKFVKIIEGCQPAAI